MRFTHKNYQRGIRVQPHLIVPVTVHEWKLASRSGRVRLLFRWEDKPVIPEAFE